MRSDRLKLLTLVSLLVFVTYIYIGYEHHTKTPTAKQQATQQRNQAAEHTHKVTGCYKEITKVEQWTPPSLIDKLQNHHQTSAKLAEVICNEWLLPPFTVPRQLKHPDKEHYSQRGQSMFVDRLLKHKRNGFYIESGAADGEGLSNSLFFEKSRNWTGLLVEANPINFREILRKRRHAYMVNTCLSPTQKPMKIPFTTAGYIGGLTQYMERTHKKRIKDKFTDSDTFEIQCFPLFAILKALGISHVDYFSLDVEGAELDVLMTLPLDAITVEIFSIEYAISDNKKGSQKKLKAISDYLVGQYGYTIVQSSVGEDVILRRTNNMI